MSPFTAGSPLTSGGVPLWVPIHILPLLLACSLLTKCGWLQFSREGGRGLASGEGQSHVSYIPAGGDTEALGGLHSVIITWRVAGAARSSCCSARPSASSDKGWGTSERGRTGVDEGTGAIGWVSAATDRCGEFRGSVTSSTTPSQ